MTEAKNVELRELSEEEIEAVAGGKITEHQINGGGNEPNGQANGIPEVFLNPAGNAPGGWN